MPTFKGDIFTYAKLCGKDQTVTHTHAHTHTGMTPNWT